MGRLWSGSVCGVLLLTCFACADSADAPGGETDAGPAADSGGKSGSGGAGGADAYKNGGSGGAGGQAGSSTGGHSGSGGAAGSTDALDIDPAECMPDPTSFSACGGDIVGKWRMASFCLDGGLDALRENLMCPELTQDFKVDYRMLVQFAANGDYHADMSSDIAQKVVVPKSCLAGASTDCTALEAATTDTNDGTMSHVTDSGDSCLLDVTQHNADQSAGSFTVDGNTITVRDEDGPDTSEYCVEGDKLTVRSTQSSGEVTWGRFTRE